MKLPRRPHIALPVQFVVMATLCCSVAAPADAQNAAPPKPGTEAHSEVSHSALKPWRDLLGKQRVSGVVDVSVAGKGALHHSLGTDVSDVDITNHSVFWIGSVSKQFAAAAVLRLVDEGKVDLNAPVSSYLPLGKDALQRGGQRCTVMQILSHTCGLPGGSNRCPSLNLHLPNNRKRFLQCVSGTDLVFQPGTDHEYANLGTDLAGVLAATVAKTSYRNLLQRAFFGPLEMTSTGTNDLGARPGVKKRLVQGQLVIFGAPISSANWLRLDPTGPGHRGPSGNVYSTAHDLHLWNRALHRGKVLSKSSYEAMITPVRNHYGLGIATKTFDGDRKSIWHNGAIVPMNWSAHLAYVPHLDASIVVLSARNMKRSRMDPIGFGIADTLIEQAPASLPLLGYKPAILDGLFYAMPLLILGCLFFVLIQLLRGPRKGVMPWVTGVFAASGVAMTVSNSLDFYQQHVLMGSLFALLPTIGLLLHHRQVVTVRDEVAGKGKDRRGLYMFFGLVVVLGLTSRGAGRQAFFAMVTLFAAMAVTLLARDAMIRGNRT
ncbi:MAG: beta-lactamase family protein [Myxococcales bacterium]|nr:beta-lactamase family protein [Myxococcales bacterium]